MKDDPETERLAAELVKMLNAPRACTEPPWQAILDRIDDAKIARVLGKRKKREPGCQVPRELWGQK